MEIIITYEEYLEAMEKVHKYHKQLNDLHSIITHKSYDKLEMYIYESDFSVRIKNVCQLYDIIKVKDIVTLGKVNLKSLPNLGIKSYREIIQSFFEWGINLE